MIKKIALFLPDVLRKRGGGPSTYSYNLELGIEKIANKISENVFRIENFEINFFHCGIKESLNEISQDIAHLAKNQKFYIFLKKLASQNPIIYVNFLFFYRLRRLLNKNLPYLKMCDVVNFQDPFSLYLVKKKIKNKKIKMNLTIHSPDDPVVELENISYLYSKKNFLSKVLYYIYPFKLLQKISNKGIALADHLIYPTKEAIDVHFNTIPLIKTIYIKNPNKFLYCLTGCPPLKNEKSREEIRNELGLKTNDFVVLFIGRHNEYKGFDILLEAIIELRNKYGDIVLISAGRGPLSEEHINYQEFWKYLGFVEKVGDLINSADVHCIPNRESYFDIGLVESLSVGTPIITTYTGGHKFFKDKSKGLIIIKPNKEELINAIEYLKNAPKNLKEIMRSENKRFYEQNFSLEKFALNYVSLLKEIIKN